MAEMVRINTNISKQINDWLNRESQRTGFTKSTLIHMALYHYRKKVEKSSTRWHE